MHRSTLLAAVALLALVSACTDRTPPATAPNGADTPATQSSGPAVERERFQRLARHLARALRDSAFRATLRGRLEASRFPEHKLHFQGVLAGDNQRLLTEIARLSGAPEAELREDAANAGAIEIYLPVPEHRRAWQGEEDILVATALTDDEAPVAWDTRGGKHLLDRAAPPSRPVLGLVPAETDFQATRPAGADCTEVTCPPTDGGNPGGGGGGIPSPMAPGLYMTYAHTTQTFESWLKGNPEFEVHILGQLGQTDSLADYQCAGEHAGGPYQYDQNSTDWTGNVLLFSQAQLDSYRVQHPGQSIRVFMVEDDDTACDIRNGGTTMEEILAAVDGAYSILTGGRDSLAGPIRYFRKARAYQKLLQKLAQIIKTNDELVGNAIEDAVVGQYYPGANWIIKGEKNVTNGWIKLVMK